MVPILVSFLISYGVLYDFTLKRLNMRIQWYFDNTYDSTSGMGIATTPYLKTSFREELPVLSENLSTMQWQEDDDYALIKMTISPNVNGSSSGLGANALSYAFLDELNSFQSDLLHNHQDIVSIVSPLQFWPHFLDPEPQTPELTLKRQLYTDSLLRYINSRSSVQLDGFFLKSVRKLNNLIDYANAINIYVISHNNNNKKRLDFEDVINSHPLVCINLQMTSNKNSIKDFTRFIIREASKKYSYYSILSDIVAHSIVIITSIVFIGYVTLCILNQYKIRSKFGLCIGWYIEVLISCCGAVLIMGWIKGKEWSVLYEPSTIVTRFSYIFMVLLMSSNGMLNLITYLSGDNGFYEGENGLRIRIYKFFMGIDTLESPTVKPCGGDEIDCEHSTNGNLFSLQCEAIAPTLCSYLTKTLALFKSMIVIPPTVKCFFVNLFVLSFLNMGSMSMVRLYYEGAISDYFCKRISNFIHAVMIAITIDQILQLTYLVCIIVMDLKRFELTDILNMSGNRRDSDFSSSSVTSEEVFGVNCFSSYLLKLSSPPSMRPPRSSFRHQLGQYLLKIKNPAPLCLRLGFNTSIEIGFLLATFLSWTISIPHELLNDKIKIYEELTVESTSFDIFFYLELLSIVIIVVAMSGVLFKFSYSEIARFMKKSASNSLEVLFEFDYESKKYFNSIDLLLNEGSIKGHKLDVLKIGTNSSSPFIVTIGLDHKVLIWSPLCKPEVPTPINVSLIMNINGKEFWPINHINISNDGNYIIIINYKYGLVKCYERKQLKYIWEIQLPGNLLSSGKIKILESFFRRRTVPGYLTRKIHQQKKAARKLKAGGDGTSRRDSVSSVISSTSTMSSLNGNYQAPLVVSNYLFNDIKEDDDEVTKPQTKPSTVNGCDAPNNIATRARAPNGNTDKYGSISPKDDFIFVLESGEIVTITCTDGSIKTTSILQSIYPNDIGNSLRITSAKKLSTPRVNDRIICHLNNFDIIVAAMVNNNFNIKSLSIQQGFYNTGLKFVSPMMATTTSLNESNDFKSICDPSISGSRSGSNGSNSSNSSGSKYNFRTFSPDLDHLSDSSLSSTFQFNKSDIITVEFVGMIIRVKSLSAELIDIQTGVLLKTFSIGHFKPKSLKVSHLEPTHCKFCGCASIQSFSLCYEDYDTSTLIMHTFRIDAKKLKNNICLRVERDPREIRCLGFSAVTEHQYWYDDIEKWELTDINVIIGIKKRNEVVRNELVDDGYETQSSGVDRHFSSLVQETGLTSLRSRDNTKNESLTRSKKATSLNPTKLHDVWVGFIITANDGNLMNYEIPSGKVSQLSLSVSKPLCIEKFGYKSVAISFGNLVKVLYLGNDKLIEKDLYYSGTNTGLGSVLPNNDVNAAGVNNGLLFINKRRMHRERGRR